MHRIANPARILALFVVGALSGLCQSGSRATRNVIFVMADGLRVQEVFSGVDPLLLNKQNGAVSEPEEIRKLYWRESVEERRRALLPFFWSVVGKHGQIYGNRARGSEVYVTNGLNFSYPGYSETLCGFPDSRIESNDKIPNPNVTVLEWLHKRPGFAGKIAAFAAWDAFPAILNAARAGFPVNAGYDPLTGIPPTPELQLLNRLKAELPRLWDAEPFDAVTFRTALEYLKAKKPRILYISLGETDEWAHAGQYSQYLDAAHRTDDYVAALWNLLQSMPEYRGTTTLVLSTDHGRGHAPAEWKDHGKKVPDSKYTWLAILGPDTRPMGERTEIPAVTQNQIAATLASLLGEDYLKDVPRAGKPIPDALPRASSGR